MARMGQMRNAYNILVGKSERKRTLGRPRRRCEDNNRMNWNLMARYRDQCRALCECGNEPSCG
jgi:hypothetical protein